MLTKDAGQHQVENVELPTLESFGGRPLGTPVRRRPVAVCRVQINDVRSRFRGLDTSYESFRKPNIGGSNLLFGPPVRSGGMYDGINVLEGGGQAMRVGKLGTTDRYSFDST
jgi:hypothetical protein